MSEKVSVEKEDDLSSSSKSATGSGDVSGNSPLNTLSDDFRASLDEFRNNWQQELQQNENNEPVAQLENRNVEARDDLNVLQNYQDISAAEKLAIAERLFWKAVNLEQLGKVYEALIFYRKAVQIEPDIEYICYERQKSKSENNTVVENIKKSNDQTEHDHDHDEDELIVNLSEKFEMDLSRYCDGKWLLKNRNENVISTQLHISDLPPEIILYILRWVVSMQLDMKSLEHCSRVCKGFYLYARDEEIWRMACNKVWGINRGTLNNPTAPITNDMEQTEHMEELAQYNSWRQMFIERDRLLFNGCYISQTKYIRLGENQFQDQFYRPLQLIEYYRYIRFLPDGQVFMMTNADEPSRGVKKLKNVNQIKSDIMRGHYRLCGNAVTLILKRQKQRHQNRRSTKVKREDSSTTKFCIEFRIMSTPKRKFAQLVWMRYYAVQVRNKVENTTEFMLTQSKYPALWFSPVRSYHLAADAPLS